MLILGYDAMHGHGVIHTQYRSLSAHKRMSDPNCVPEDRESRKSYAKQRLQLEDRAMIHKLTMELPTLLVEQLQKMA